MSYDRWNTSEFGAERANNLADDLDLLRDNLCRHWGFCNRLNIEDLLSEGAITASAFGDHVLRAEDFDPALEPEYQSAIRKVFVERYGGTEISIDSYSNSTMT